MYIGKEDIDTPLRTSSAVEESTKIKEAVKLLSMVKSKECNANLLETQNAFFESGKLEANE